MRTILTTFLAVVVISLLWFRLGSFSLQPATPMPQPSTLAAPADSEPVVATPVPSAPLPRQTPTPSKPAPAPLTAAELDIKTRLERQMTDDVPTHRITFDKFRTLTGWIVKENSNQVTFSESYGNTGSMSVNISRKRIVSIETLSHQAPVITDRDVRFQAEFPRMNLFKRHPYTIVTDESYFQVERIVEDLQSTYAQFTARFRPLVLKDRASASDIQVLVFSSQEAFRNYSRVHFGATNEIAGFYMINQDRLVVFNQTTANWIQAVIDKETEETIAIYGDTEDVRRQIGEQRGARENDLKWFAKQFTVETIRHEGAHQMSYTLGILRLYPRDFTWLSEGLALYAETDKLGEVNRWRLQELKGKFPDNRYPDIETVIRASYAADYLTSYSSYWALTYFLMESSHRNQFFQFIRQLGNPATWREHPAPSDMELLCRALDTDAASLNKEWIRFLSRL